MNFLTKGEFFKDHSRAVVLCVSTDTVAAHIVKKESGRTEITHTAVELLESASFDAVVLNSEKALQALPAEARQGVKHCIIALSAGTGAYFFVRAQGVRQDKEKKITSDELAAVVSKWYGAEKDAAAVMFRNIPQRVWVDGFAVPDAVGFNGKEITVDIASFAADAAFARALEEFFSAAGMRLAGFFDMRAVAASFSGFFRESDSALIAVVGEAETNVLLVRERSLAGIGALHAGYGILRGEIARAYGVGKAEARNIEERVRSGAADAGFVRQATDAWRAALETNIKQLVAVVSGIDPSRLLPGAVWIVSMEPAPDWYDALRDGKWLAGLPLERNAKVTIAAEDPAQHTALWKQILEEYLL